MPKHRQVPTLKTLSLRAVGSLIVSLSSLIVAKLQVCHNSKKIVTGLYDSLNSINRLLASHVPYNLCDAMAVEVLYAVRALIEETKETYYTNTLSAFLKEMNVVVSLTEVVLTSHLKQIDFTEWKKEMRYVLYKKLSKLTGLEVLKLDSRVVGWRSSDYKTHLLRGISGMTHLRSLCFCFDCTDQVIQVIGDNCPLIQCLDVEGSQSVTDRSIPALLKCSQLREVQLEGTSITPLGLAQILRGFPNLQNIGRCYFKDVVKELVGSGPFGLRKIYATGLPQENLRLLADMFPKVDYLDYMKLADNEEVTDLTIFTSLDCLKELELQFCAFYGDYLKQLLEVRGGNITNLHLVGIQQIDLNALSDIGHFCPRLKSLVIHRCDFMDSMSINYADKPDAKPFQCLEKFCLVDRAINHLEFILLHAVNIRNILLESTTGIPHSSIDNILTVNPMKHLEELRISYSSDMSMRTVELLLGSCDNLRVLSELEKWQGISKKELKVFKQQIYSKNFDLDIRPNHSFVF